MTPTTLTVKNAEDWEGVNELAADFADGVVKELALAGADFVNFDGRLFFGESNTLTVHAQMQNAADGTSARLQFSGVQSVSFNREQEVTPARARALRSGAWEVEMLSLRVVAEECVVTIVGHSGLGDGPFLLAPQ